MKTILFTSLIILTTFAIYAQDTSSFRASDGEKLFYTTYNSGEKIIFLYGGPGYGSNIIHYWHKSIKNNQCIFYDQRGTGLSGNAKVDTSTINLNVAVNDIEDLRKHLKEEKLTILGFSWGAGLAMAYAAKYPKNVNQLILVSPIGPDLTFASEQYYNILSRRSIQESDSLKYWFMPSIIAADSVIAKKKQAYYTYIPYFFDHAKGSPLMWKLINEAEFNPAVFKLMMQNLKDILYDIKMDLKTYKGKCNIIRGEQDVIGYKTSALIQQWLPQTEIFEISGCGHFVDQEASFAFFNKLKKIVPDK